MGSMIRLTASDRHEFSAYLCAPEGPSKGGIVVIQEIFGVNSHIKEVTDRIATAGYLAIAPALFDRVKPNTTLKYDDEGVSKGRQFKDETDLKSELDVKAALEHVRSAGNVAALGFCWGGSLAWRVATDEASRLAAAISYYGGELPSLVSRMAACPFMAHFGIHDGSIPEEGARAFASAQPMVETYFYDAGHGFNCDHRSQYDTNAAQTAWRRSMTFLAKHMN